MISYVLTQSTAYKSTVNWASA